MKERILRWGVGRVLNIDKTLPPTSHIKNYWIPIHIFEREMQGVRNYPQQMEPVHMERSREEFREGSKSLGKGQLLAAIGSKNVSINIDLVPSPPATTRNNVSRVIECGAKY